MSARPIAPRTVKPRKTGYVHRNIIAISRETDEIFIERTGELVPYSKLPVLIAAEPSSIVATVHAGIIVKTLDDVLGNDPRWQFKLTPVRQDFYGPNRKVKRTVTKRTTVAFFGFQATRNPRQASRYHYPIDPTCFVGQGIHDLIPGDAPRVFKLYSWAEDLRSFLKENDLVIRPTSGGIAGQLLKDKRFYPEDRRKVPRATNAKARKQLPGNYYRLYVKERTVHTATYLDQKSAHHSCAEGITFPDADSLYAKGHFHKPELKPMAIAGSKRFAKLIQEHGLFYVKLRTPKVLPIRFPLPCMEKEGLHSAWIFSNEIEDIQKLGGKVESIIAQWTSPDAERGLNRYAKWSLAELDDSDSFRKAWLKPLLLSTYGILAARPKEIEFGFKRAKGGEKKLYPVGSGALEVMARVSTATHEMPTANVIHRCMIEAETRLRSLRLARYLTGRKMKVLAIYADSVFVDTKGQGIPLLDSRWQVKGELSRLQFFNSTSFTSDVLTKLPGIPREGMDTVRRLEAIRNQTNADSPLARERRRLRQEEG